MAGDDVLERSWQRAWPALAAAGDGSAVRDALLAAYREPDRHYHTLQHLRECIECLAACGELAQRPAEVEIALWFHDAVHDVHRHDNERRSAGRVPRSPPPASAPTSSRASMRSSWRRATRRRRRPVPTSSCWSTSTRDPRRRHGALRRIRDADPTRVRARAGARRARRSAVLASFLARDPIYRTPRLRDALEARARTNLALAIAQNVG